MTFTGKVLRWKLYLQDRDFDLYHVPGKEEYQFVPDALSRLCVNNVPPPPTVASRMIVALRPVMQLPPDIRDRLTRVHNSKVGHWGLDICKRRIREQHRRQGGRDITDRMISEFIRQCPACQVMNRMKVQIKAHRFTCASYNSLEVLHLDHIGQLTKDAHGHDAFSRWVELFPTKSTTALETASVILNHIGRFGSPEVIHTDQGPAFHNDLVFYDYVVLSNHLPRRFQAKRTVSWCVLIKRYCDTYVHYSLIVASTISGRSNNFY